MDAKLRIKRVFQIPSMSNFSLVDACAGWKPPGAGIQNPRNTNFPFHKMSGNEKKYPNITSYDTVHSWSLASHPWKVNFPKEE